MHRATIALTALVLLAATALPVRAQDVVAPGDSTVPAYAVPAEEGFDGLVIRVYDLTGIDRDRRAEAIRVAGVILKNAGVDAEWLDCRRGPGTSASACDAYRRPTDLIIRIVHGSLATEVADRPALGVSIVDTGARSGVLATIFANRLEPVVRRTGADPALLLARTIAHEVGHLLLRTNDHFATGLMRATWTDVELAKNRPQDWVFASRITPLLARR